MDEFHRAALRRFFSVFSVIFFVIYLFCLLLALFSPSVSSLVFGCLVVVAISLMIIQDAVDTKAEELGVAGARRFLSLPSFTSLFMLCMLVMVYLKIKPGEVILWVNIALIASNLLDTSLRALRRLKLLEECL